MAKPIISKFSVIDMSQNNTVRYTCYDDTVNEVEYVIYDNASGNIIVDKTIQTSGATSIRTFDIPAGIVYNRLLPYYLKIAVKNQSGVQSDLSDAVLFYCHSRPTLAFKEVNSSAVKTIPFPAFSFDVVYTNNEDEGELLTRCDYMLYDGEKNIIKKETHYGSDPCSFSVDGLDNNTAYYVKAVGETVNGYIVDSGYCEFLTQYNGQLQNLEITATNKKEDGSIVVSVAATFDKGEYDSLRIKRRILGSYDWMILTEYDVKNKIGSLAYSYTDKYARGRNTKYQYAVVPVTDNIEQEPATTIVKSLFDGAWIVDKDISYYIGLEPKVSNLTRNRDTAVETTLGSKYPIVFYGSESNYYSGNFSGVAIKFDRANDYFDFDGSFDYRENLINWLTNGEPKVLKMWDGRAWLMNVNGSISYSDDEHFDKVELSFDFVETGDLNSENDMRKAGLI